MMICFAFQQMARTDNDYLNALMSRIQLEIQDNWKVMRRAFKVNKLTNSLHNANVIIKKETHKN